MAWKARKVISGLKDKGFRQEERHHHYFYYQTLDGKLSSIFTYTSHSGEEINDYLAQRMAKQCRLKLRQFRGLIQCPLSQHDYEKLLRDAGELP